MYTPATAALMPLAEWRMYLLVKITGWTLDQIDAAPAESLDWILEMHRLEVEIADEAEEAARAGRRR